MWNGIRGTKGGVEHSIDYLIVGGKCLMKGQIVNLPVVMDQDESPW